MSGLKRGIEVGINMQKIVINIGVGSFTLSYFGVMEYAKRKGINIFAYKRDRELEGRNRFIRIAGEDKDLGYERGIIYSTSYNEVSGYTSDIFGEGYFDDTVLARDDKDLVAMVEDMGEKVEGKYSELKVVEIPDDVRWHISNDDAGQEWVAENHRTWN